MAGQHSYVPLERHLVVIHILLDSTLIVYSLTSSLQLLTARMTLF